MTTDERDELKALIVELMDGERERRRLKYLEGREKEPPPERESKVYLITTSPHGRIAFPDEKGRAVLHETVYARVVSRKGTHQVQSGFSIFDVESMAAIAFSDGKLLDKPFPMIVNTVPSMIEIEDGFLESL